MKDPIPPAQLAEFARGVAAETVQQFAPFLLAMNVDQDAAETMLALGGGAARGLMHARGIKPKRDGAHASLCSAALRILVDQRPEARQVRALAAACASAAILQPTERIELASMLPALFRVTDQEHEQLLGLADGKAPAGGVGALLSELGLVEGKRATRIGMAFGAALRLVEQIAPEFDVVRDRSRSG